MFAVIFFKKKVRGKPEAELWRTVEAICTEYGFAGFSGVEADGKPHLVTADGPRTGQILTVMPVYNPAAVPVGAVRPPRGRVDPRKNSESRVYEI